MKVIFLDIDGVLNDDTIFKRNKEVYDRKTGRYVEIDVEKLLFLKEIVDKTGAKIVMSSSWRNFWNENPLTPKLIKAKLFEEILEKYSLSIYDMTPRFGLRENEIKMWLKNHPEVESYVVLDDDLEHVEGFKEEGTLVKTSFYAKEHQTGGLQESDIELAVKILERKL